MPHQKATMYDNNECFNLVKKQTEEKKINPKKVFKGYNAPKSQKPTKGKKVPKGFHRMPDGSLMKGDKHPTVTKGDKKRY